MKTKLIVISILFASICFGQSKSLPFFAKNGNIALHTTQIDALADTLAVINHRWDDVIWYRVVYKIIDLREKQNNQLYFPIIPNEKYKSLFRTIMDATVNNSKPVPVYKKMDFNFQPLYDQPFDRDSLPQCFLNCTWDTTLKTGVIPIMKGKLIKKNYILNNLEIDTTEWEDYAKKQMKFVVQEIVFFDRHYSRMYSKIIGIAPVFIYNQNNVDKMIRKDLNKEGESVWNFFINSVQCWYLYDELRPYLAKQFVIPNGNDGQAMTFDEFFAQKLYSSYLLGDSNMFDRMLLQNYNDPTRIVKEQKRIETELLNTELDLWEY